MREWDYLFNLREADGQVKQCQYKILFDTKQIARSFYWNPEGCNEQPVKPARAPAAADKHVVLSADALFAFGKSGLGDVNARGRQELNALAQDITANGQPKSVRVTGYTDRIGSDAYNMRLSQARADTVREYLVRHGVEGDLITAEGRGKADPVTQCHESNRAELIACLAPNRRVTVDVTPAK